MTRFGVKEEISQGKNELATGGGARNDLFKSVVLTVYISGEDVDNINWYKVLSPGEEDKFEITKMEMKIAIGYHDNSTR